MPVVGHLQEALPPFPDLDLNLDRAGIKAVLDQFFSDVCRTFHHFTCGDFGGYILRKNLNAHSA